MEDTDRLIIQQKLQQSHDDQEFAVEGSAIGEDGWVPCVIESASGSDYVVKISDGHRTGETVSVEARHVVSFGTEFINDATGRLFR